MSTVEQHLTPDDVLAMPDGDRYELIDGELKDLNVSQESSWVAGEIYRRLANFVMDGQLGWVFPEGTSYQCFPDDPLKFRRADTSFIVRDRLPEGPTGMGHTPIAPDLAVEVVSPHDSHYDVTEKVADYLNAGVRLVWVVTPVTRTVMVHRHDALSSPRHLTVEDDLTGDDVLPRFSCRVADLFPPQAETSTS